VWRPANGCAMNSAGSTGYCPVCREATVLRIYSYVNPIDQFSPTNKYEMFTVEGDEKLLTITPMQPLTHELEVTWFVETLGYESEGPPEDEKAGSGFTYEGGMPPPGFFTAGMRGRRDRGDYEKPPTGDLSKLGAPRKRKKGEPRRHQFDTTKLPAGRYKITAQVVDTTKMKKAKHPWVLKDPKKLLEERLSWWITVDPKED